MSSAKVPQVRERHVLDLIRWVSAGLVALGHVLGLVIHKPAAGVSFGSLEGVLSYISDLRSASVIVFFVLSGYLVGGSLLRRENGIDWIAYLTARFARIYIVLIPALLLTAGLDGLLIGLHHGASVYTTVWASGVLGNDAILQRYGATNVLGSLLSLEPLFGQPLGSNGALWSLGYEWIFYLAFPLIVVTGRRILGRPGPYVVALVVVMFCVLLHARWMAVFFTIWMLGACAEQLTRRRLVPAPVSAALGIAAIAAFLCAPALSAQLSTCLVGVTCAAYLAQHQRFEDRLRTPVDHRLAAASYSLYLTHMVAITACADLLMRLRILDIQGRRTDALAALEVIGMLCTAALVAAGFYIAFERHTARLRRAIYGTITRRRSQMRLAT